MSLLLAAHTQTLSADDRFQIAQCGIKIIIDDKVIIFRVMAHFCNCLSHTFCNHLFAILTTTAQTAVQLNFGRR